MPRISPVAGFTAFALLTLAVAPPARAADPLPPPAPRTAEQDHQEMMDRLHITSLRPGADGFNAKAPNAQNTDETKATRYTNLPDPLVLKNGRKVTTAKAWWVQRRPEIVEDFDREVYGRVPKTTPKVTWEVVKTTPETNGDVPVITKQLVGHVDNSADPAITVNIQLTLTTPANAARPGAGHDGVRLSALSGRPWRLSLLPPARPGSSRCSRKAGAMPSWSRPPFQADNGAGLTQGIIGLCNKGLPRKPDDWGALRAWAWGASRALDYFGTDKAVDAKQVGLEGLSRYGKAVLVAMAYEPRFAIVFVGSSGEGGAKLWRRNLGRDRGQYRVERRVSLDGRQLPQVRRAADAGRPAGGLARADRVVRPAPRLH